MEESKNNQFENIESLISNMDIILKTFPKIKKDIIESSVFNLERIQQWFPLPLNCYEIEEGISLEEWLNNSNKEIMDNAKGLDISQEETDKIYEVVSEMMGVEMSEKQCFAMRKLCEVIKSLMLTQTIALYLKNMYLISLPHVLESKNK